MPANSVAETRSALANAFSALAANIYSSVPEAPIPPAIVVVPDSPYMEIVLMSKAKTQVRAGVCRNLQSAEQPEPVF